MRILKSILGGLFWLLIIALMLAPIGLIYQISQEEMAAYETPTAPVLHETAYGSVVQPTRQDTATTVSVSGVFTSTTYTYMTLNYKNPSDIRWYVSTGDEIQEGQVIGSYNGKDVVSTVTGILKEMHTYGDDAYLRVLEFSPIELNCDVDTMTLLALRINDELFTTEGDRVTLLYESRQRNRDGTTNVRISVETERYGYGQQVNGLQILTGQVYRDMLTLPTNCLYQRTAGDDNPWYARQVDAEGQFIQEREVQVVYMGESWTVVSGVSENDYFDSGYKAITGG